MATATTYSYAQLEQLWINAGGPKAVAPIAAAVAEAESGGNPQATNPTDNNGTQTSWGLWQISNGTHAQPAANILDPNVNAQQAVAKYKAEGNSFSPAWGTYDSGAYKAYLSGSTTPDPNVPTATLTSATQPGGDNPNTCLIGAGEGGILGIGAASTCFFSKSEARALIGGLMVGGGFIVMGLGVALIAVFALGQSGMARRAVDATPLGRTAAIATPLPAKPKPAAKPKPPGPRSPATGRHAKTGKGAPATGKHARPGP